MKLNQKRAHYSVWSTEYREMIAYLLFLKHGTYSQVTPEICWHDTYDWICMKTFKHKSGGKEKCVRVSPYITANKTSDPFKKYSYKIIQVRPTILGVRGQH